MPNRVWKKIKNVEYGKMVKFLKDNGIDVIQPLIANEVSFQLAKNISSDEYESICKEVYDTYSKRVNAGYSDVWIIVHMVLEKRGYK